MEGVDFGVDFEVDLEWILIGFSNF